MSKVPTMKAAQITARGELNLVETALPEPDSEEVRIRLQRTAICGSDLHWVMDESEGLYPFPAGATGHECVGTVEWSPNGGPKPGTVVLAIPTKNLGFAEYMLAPFDKLITLPGDLDLSRAVVAQQLGTVLYCCRKLSNVVDKRVVVIGQGPAGLMFTNVLYNAGAREVLGIDLVDHRLDVARRLGASAVINAEREHVEQSVAAWTDGRMADLVVEAVGKDETLNMAFDLVRRGGELAYFGVPKTRAMKINVDDMLRRNLRLISSVDAQSEPNLASFRLAVKMIAEGRINAAQLVSHELPLDDIARAFELADTKTDGAVKVVLHMDTGD